MDSEIYKIEIEAVKGEYSTRKKFELQVPLDPKQFESLVSMVAQIAFDAEIAKAGRNK